MTAPITRESAARSAAETDPPRNLVLVLVLAGVLLPMPIGAVPLVGAAVVAIRSRMRPWVPAALITASVGITAYTLFTGPALSG